MTKKHDDWDNLVNASLTHLRLDDKVDEETVFQSKHPYEHIEAKPLPAANLHRAQRAYTEMLQEPVYVGFSGLLVWGGGWFFLEKWIAGLISLGLLSALLITAASLTIPALAPVYSILIQISVWLNLSLPALHALLVVLGAIVWSLTVTIPVYLTQPRHWFIERSIWRALLLAWVPFIGYYAYGRYVMGHLTGTCWIMAVVLISYICQIWFFVLPQPAAYMDIEPLLLAAVLSATIFLLISLGTSLQHTLQSWLDLLRMPSRLPCRSHGYWTIFKLCFVTAICLYSLAGPPAKPLQQTVHWVADQAQHKGLYLTSSQLRHSVELWNVSLDQATTRIDQLLPTMFKRWISQ